MKKLTIVTLTVLTTLGISAYTKSDSQSLNKVNAIENQKSAPNAGGLTATNAIILNEVGRGNLAQAD